MDLYDELYDIDSLDRKLELLRAEQLELEQPLIQRKNSVNMFSVEREYVNSKEFHDKFLRLPVSRPVQESLYRQTGRLLNFVDGQEEERMVAINARTGEFLTDNFDRPGQLESTSFKGEEIERIDTCPDLVAIIHNHSLNVRPSAQDLFSYLHEDKIKLSLVACHDGTLYGIYRVSDKAEKVYEALLEKRKTETSDINFAKMLATTDLYWLNDNIGQRQKLFDVRRF